MPSQTAIQDTLLSAAYKNALAVQANYNFVLIGGQPKNEPQINYIWLNIDGLQYQFNLGNYNTETTITLYDRLNQYIGFDTNVNSLDPNAQIPGTEIIIVNPAGYISPVDPINWSDFDPTTENPDGNRLIYYNSSWKGFNPVLSLTSPGETALRLGIDYILLSVGGFQLLNDLSGAGSPGIADGQTLRSTSYQLA